MTASQTAMDTLDREYLAIRCRLLDLAAALDRIDRGDGTKDVQRDPRPNQIKSALQVLMDERPDRAARVQMVFSDPYDSSWRDA